MFQPQTTPNSASFSSYGAGSASNYPGHYQSPYAELNSKAYSGGPTLFADRAFPPSFQALDFTHQHQPVDPHNKMSEHDLRAQEIAAQDYDRYNRVQVCAKNSYDVVLGKLT